jgi:hypothetical protein
VTLDVGRTIELDEAEAEEIEDEEIRNLQVDSLYTRIQEHPTIIQYDRCH